MKHIWGKTLGLSLVLSLLVAMVLGGSAYFFYWQQQQGAQQSASLKLSLFEASAREAIRARNTQELQRLGHLLLEDQDIAYLRISDPELNSPLLVLGTPAEQGSQGANTKGSSPWLEIHRSPSSFQAWSQQLLQQWRNRAIELAGMALLLVLFSSLAIVSLLSRRQQQFLEAPTKAESSPPDIAQQEQAAEEQPVEAEAEAEAATTEIETEPATIGGLSEEQPEDSKMEQEESEPASAKSTAHHSRSGQIKRALIRNYPGALIIFDHQLHITEANTAAKQWLNTPSQDAELDAAHHHPQFNDELKQSLSSLLEELAEPELCELSAEQQTKQFQFSRFEFDEQSLYLLTEVHPAAEVQYSKLSFHQASALIKQQQLTAQSLLKTVRGLLAETEQRAAKSTIVDLLRYGLGLSSLNAISALATLNDQQQEEEQEVDIVALASEQLQLLALMAESQDTSLSILAAPNLATSYKVPQSLQLYLQVALQQLLGQLLLSKHGGFIQLGMQVLEDQASAQRLRLIIEHTGHGEQLKSVAMTVLVNQLNKHPHLYIYEDGRELMLELEASPAAESYQQRLSAKPLVALNIEDKQLNFQLKLQCQALGLEVVELKPDLDEGQASQLNAPYLLLSDQTERLTDISSTLQTLGVAVPVQSVALCSSSQAYSSETSAEQSLFLSKPCSLPQLLSLFNSTNQPDEQAIEQDELLPYLHILDEATHEEQAQHSALSLLMVSEDEDDSRTLAQFCSERAYGLEQQQDLSHGKASLHTKTFDLLLIDNRCFKEEKDPSQAILKLSEDLPSSTGMIVLGDHRNVPPLAMNTVSVPKPINSKALQGSIDSWLSQQQRKQGEQQRLTAGLDNLALAEQLMFSKALLNENDPASKASLLTLPEAQQVELKKLTIRDAKQRLEHISSLINADNWQTAQREQRRLQKSVEKLELIPLDKSVQDLHYSMQRLSVSEAVRALDCVREQLVTGLRS